MHELLVRTASPARLDQILQGWGGVVLQYPDGSYCEDTPGVYMVRHVTGELHFLRWVIPRQGYGEVVGERPLPSGYNGARDHEEHDDAL
jgi:hypothetical protein